MRLKVLLPTEMLVDEEVTKITAEAADGSFCLLPRHIDFVTALVPGILTFETPKEKEHILAIDEGVLLKCGKEVIISTRQGIKGAALGDLKKDIEENFLVLDDREKKSRSAAARLEADLVRRFMELREYGG